jgi:hypothetical protein
MIFVRFAFNILENMGETCLEKVGCIFPDALLILYPV